MTSEAGSPGEPGGEGSEPEPSWLGPALVLGPAAAVAVYCLAHDPISRNDSHEGRLILAGVGVAMILATVFLARRASFALGWPGPLFAAAPARESDEGSEEKDDVVDRRLGRLWVGLWFAVLTYGGFNYYQFDERVFTTPGDHQDATYYYLNSKYFDELGYTRLYHAMLVADEEANKRFHLVRQYRDLETYHKFFPRQHALQNGDEVRQHFSPERWERFRHDVEHITNQMENPRDWRYFFSDHGYNPPPSWTLVGGTLSSICPVEHLKWITMVDFLLIGVVMAAIAWAFGGWAFLVSLLFFLVTFSGRWPILGQSLLRFDWVSCLVLAVCALKKGRHAWAGGLLSYSALNRIFPAVFGFPYVVWAVKNAWERKKAGEPILDEGPKRFALGVGASLTLFGILALAFVGPQAFVDSAKNLKMHGSPDSYSSHRVGLGDALVYRFETKRSEINANGGMRKKVEQLWDMRPYLQGFGALSALFIAFIIWRRREPVWRLVWMGVFPLFIMTTPQINYYNLRLLFVVLHLELLGASQHRRLHLGMLLWLFLIEVVAQGSKVAGWDRYSTTSLTSWGLMIYLVALAGYLGLEARAAPDAEAEEEDEAEEEAEPGTP